MFYFSSKFNNMSCILRIGGKHFNVDHFIKKSKLKPCNTGHKGEPKFQTKPYGARLMASFLSVKTSKAEFNELNQQIQDTVKFLKKNKEQLRLIKASKGIEFAVLDFGVDLRIDNQKHFYQSEILPKTLLKRAGNLGLSIQLSVYPSDLQANLEQHIRKQKNKI